MENTNTTGEAARPIAYIIGDTETTGLVAPIGIVEICLTQIDPDTLDVVREWSSLIDPERSIDEGASNIHGITIDMLEDEPTMPEFVQHKLNGALDGHDIVFIAHNATFDTKLVAPQIPNITATVCTLFWARQLIKDSANHKLATLQEHLGLPESTAHRAVGDVFTTRHLLRRLLEISGKTLPQLVAASRAEQTIHTMPYGKHKGQMLATLPVDYIDWLLQQDIEANLRASLKKVRKLK